MPRTAETCIVLLVPGLGDSVQIIKAGILEIADLFVINKSDREGADALQKDLRVLLSLQEFEEIDWRPPILRSVATEGTGITDIIDQFGKHQEWLHSTEAGNTKRISILKENLLKLTRELLFEERLQGEQKELDEISSSVLREKNRFIYSSKKVNKIYEY